MDLVICQYYLLLLQNFACKLLALIVMFLDYCYDNRSFSLKPEAVSQFAPDSTPMTPALKSITCPCDISSTG